jgi:IS5 family transposase
MAVLSDVNREVAIVDAMHAVLGGAGHNLRMILRELRFFYAFMLALLLSSTAHV